MTKKEYFQTKAERDIKNMSNYSDRAKRAFLEYAKKQANKKEK